ncbi:acetyltransferase [Aeromicrobium sp.]|uniref:acetyltransferase n=1 Tax=Aeromicrobium sp. TaxID=1871063 RepID=UPI004033C0AA
MPDLLIVGCGGFGRETADVVDAVNDVHPTWNLLGFLDDHPSDDDLTRVARRGVEVVDDVRTALAGRPPVPYVIGIGSPTVRSALAQLFDEAGWSPASLVHPQASVSRTASLAPGTIIAAQAAVGADVALGRHVHVDRGAQVGHDTIVEDFVTLHPSVTVSGSCHLEVGARLGTASTVLPGMVVGAGALVGASACVARRVPPGQVVKGVPAR